MIRLLTPQQLTLAAGSVQSVAFKCTQIALRATVDIFVAIGTNPVATVDGNTCHFIGAGEALPLSVPLDGKLAAIPAFGSTGTVYISEVRTDLT